MFEITSFFQGWMEEVYRGEVENIGCTLTYELIFYCFCRISAVNFY